MKLRDKNPHVLDKNIHLDLKTHVYSINGDTDYTSGTRFIHKFFSKFDADKIINKLHERWQRDKNSKYYGLEKQEIKKQWQDNAQSCSNFGTMIHNGIEDYLNEVDNDTEAFSQAEFKYFLDFMDDYSEFEPYRAEMMIYDPEFKIAGTIDLLVKKGNKYYIVDHKTNKEIKLTNTYNKAMYPISHLDECNFIQYSLQLNLYKYILEKYYDIEIEDLYLLHLRKANGSYKIIKCLDLQKEIKSMLLELKK